MKTAKSALKDNANFDDTVEASGLYEFLSKHVSSIAVFNLVFKGKNTIDEIANSINKCEYNDKFGFVFGFYCEKCGKHKPFATETLAESNFKEQKKKGCPVCKTDRFVKKKIIYEIGPWDVKSIFIYGMSLGVFKPYHYVQCAFCPHSEDFDPNKIDWNCKECKAGLNEVRVDFRLNELISDHFAKNEKQGYWLEWYVARFLKSKNITPDMNRKFKDHKQEVEVDLIYETNGKKICVLCDTSKDSEFDVENFHLIPEMTNSKQLVLVTTNKKISQKLTSAAGKYFEKTIAIHFNDLTSLDKKLPI